MRHGALHSARRLTASRWPRSMRNDWMSGRDRIAEPARQVRPLVPAHVVDREHQVDALVQRTNVARVVVRPFMVHKGMVASHRLDERARLAVSGEQDLHVPARLSHVYHRIAQPGDRRLASERSNVADHERSLVCPPDPFECRRPRRVRNHHRLIVWSDQRERTQEAPHKLRRRRVDAVDATLAVFGQVLPHMPQLLALLVKFTSQPLL